ncbi:hypothetical protein CGRA01v4_02580 [Colletotrichum graminicola]|nr:hypothetical protein CGRA01v4_02580 [Colletotrichum graminicola]
MVLWPGTLLWVSMKAWTDQPIDRLLDWFGLLFGPILTWGLTWGDGTHSNTLYRSGRCSVGCHRHRQIIDQVARPSSLRSWKHSKALTAIDGR